MKAFRTMDAADFTSVLALNDAEVRQTSPLDMEQLCSLVRMSSLAVVATVHDQVAAFLIALREGAPYESDNYRWFNARFPAFLYVDRIVVDPRFARHRIGSRLYDDLFAFARTQGVGKVTCEYNITPPNPASQAFHARYGFTEVGSQWVAGGTKQVSLQAADT